MLALFLCVWLTQLTLAPLYPEVADWAHEFWREATDLNLFNGRIFHRVSCGLGWFWMVFVCSAVAYLFYEAGTYWHEEEAKRARIASRAADWNNMLGTLEPFFALGVSLFLLSEHTGIDLSDAVRAKLAKNAVKYPVD